MRLTTLYIAACLITASVLSAFGGENCGVCHKVALQGAHKGLACLSCHLSGEKTVADPAFVAQAKKERADVGYVSPEDIQKIIEHVYSQPEPVLKRAGAAMLGKE